LRFDRGDGWRHPEPAKTAVAFQKTDRCCTSIQSAGREINPLGLTETEASPSPAVLPLQIFGIKRYWQSNWHAYISTRPASNYHRHTKKATRSSTAVVSYSRAAAFYGHASRFQRPVKLRKSSG
jgi:hypothetical protein